MLPKYAMILPMETLDSGITRFSFGTPERQTPIRVLASLEDAFQSRPLQSQPDTRPLLSDASFMAKATARGFRISFAMADDEDLYGLGLQLKSFNQRGLKKTLRVNSDPVADTGDSHAPVPFFLSTRGYGLFVDTNRYVTFYFGTHEFVERGAPSSGNGGDDCGQPADSTDGLYKQRAIAARRIVIDIPACDGADLYLFDGPSMKEALARYNRFFGGGAMPPLWGLRNWYRAKTDAPADRVVELMDYFTARDIPIDVIGLEPGWQTKAYSCSYVWNPALFPDPRQFLSAAAKRGYHTNLWEHAYVHPDSPIHDALLPVAGDTRVWHGLVPDFSCKQARDVFARHHQTEFVDNGVSGFKLDECDNSDYIASPWAFPETSEFPGGMDGEQMHSEFGLLYQHTVLRTFRERNQRTYSLVRSSHAGASPYPFVLYSDLYNHKDFIRGTVNAGFSGLLWTPELRDAKSEADLLRRLQTVVFSPLSLINAWYLKNPPWLQINCGKNNANEFMEGRDALEAQCRDILKLREAFVPYLYAAFRKYATEGIPPFRALVLDYPEDKNTHGLDLQYLMGDDVLVAPLTAEETERSVYLPAGIWYSFWDKTRYEGGRSYTISTPLGQIPLFVKAGTTLPLALSIEHEDDGYVIPLAVTFYGPSCRDAALFEDDGVSYDFEDGAFNLVSIRDTQAPEGALVRQGTFPKQTYRVAQWERVD